jgi:hypothetical protein
MSDLDDKIEEIKVKIYELQKDLAVIMNDAAKPKNWSPVGGDYYVNSDGDIHNDSASCRSTREFGVERPTQQQAERAAVEMRKFNRLLALRDELCGDDAELGIYHFIFQNRDGTYFIGYSEQQNNEIGSVRFTTKESTQRACDMLNSGEVEL